MHEIWDNPKTKNQFRKEEDLLKLLRRWPIRDYRFCADLSLRYLFGINPKRLSQLELMVAALMGRKDEFEAMWLPREEFVKNIKEWADKNGFYVYTFDFESMMSPDITFQMKKPPELNLDTLAYIIKEETNIELQKEPNVTNRLPATLWYLNRNEIKGKFLYLHDDTLIQFKDFFEMKKKKIEWICSNLKIEVNCQVISEFNNTYNCLIVQLKDK